MLNVKKTLTEILSWIKGKNHVGLDYSSQVDITSYNASNKFTCPSDGMVKVECNYRSTSYTILYDENGAALAQGSAPSNANMAGAIIMNTPVYKGQKVYISRGSNNYGAGYFVPYKLG